MSFNPSQREAIRHKDGPMLVLAGPGSGKTLVITERTRHLITEYGINPANILVITFTRAAATEMKERFLRLGQAAAARLLPAQGRSGHLDLAAAGPQCPEQDREHHPRGAAGELHA